MIYNVGDETHIDLSDDALRAVEGMIRSNAIYPDRIQGELDTFANVIRAHLQHQVPALPGRSAPKKDDDSWLE